MKAALLMLGLAGCSIGFTSRVPDEQGACASNMPPVVDAVLSLAFMASGSYLIIEGDHTDCHGDTCSNKDLPRTIGGMAMVGVGVIYAASAAIGVHSLRSCRKPRPPAFIRVD